jgi:hypothetical protein
MSKPSNATVTLSVEEYLTLREKAQCAEDVDRIVVVSYPRMTYREVFTTSGTAKFDYRGKNEVLKQMSEANADLVKSIRSYVFQIEKLPRRYRRRFEATLWRQ